MRSFHALAIVGFTAAIYGATASPAIAETREEALKKKAAKDIGHQVWKAEKPNYRAANEEWVRLRALDPAAGKQYFNENAHRMGPQDLKFGSVSRSPLGIVTGKHQNSNPTYNSNQRVDTGSGGITDWSRAQAGGHSTGPGAKTLADQNRLKTMPVTSPSDRFQAVQKLGVKPSDPSGKR